MGQKLGRRLLAVTQKTAETMSDYWVISEAGDNVIANWTEDHKVVPLPWNVADMANDWMILQPGSFLDAVLVSENTGTHQNLAWTWCRTLPKPAFEETFDFPERTAENEDELNFSRQGHRKSSSNSSSSHGAGKKSADQLKLERSAKTD